MALPVFARDAFGTARDLGLMLAGFGLGSLAGSLLFGVVGPKLPRRAALVGWFLVAGLPLLPLAATPPLPTAIAALAVAGFGTGVINPVAGTVLQKRIPPELRGRVLGAFMAEVLVAAPLGVLVAGGLSEAVALRPLLLATGVILVAAALPIAVLPAFRGLDRPEAVRAGADATDDRS